MLVYEACACVYVRTHMRPSYTGIVVVVYINTAKVGHKLQATAQSPADTLKNLPPPLDRYPFSSAQGKLARELGEEKQILREVEQEPRRIAFCPPARG